MATKKMRPPLKKGWLWGKTVVLCALMKNMRLPFLTVVLLVAMAFSAAAQTKIGTVDMKKLFSDYWKTKKATAALEVRKTELKKEMREMTDNLEKAQADYKQLLDQSNDAAISDEERDKRKQAAAAKATEINTSATSLKQFQTQAESQLADESQRMSGNLVADIQKIVADKAKAGGYAIILNASSSEAVVYAGPSTDMTGAVLAELNAGAPIDLNEPSRAAMNISTNVP
jgi:Skp family chaperone for outer membrane proteins